MPATINKYLRDYQRDGVSFLFRQYAQGQGGILGDDMVGIPFIPFTAHHTMACAYTMDMQHAVMHRLGTWVYLRSHI